GIHRRVAISELRTLAGGAAVGIGFADDDRLRLEFGKRRNDAEALVDRRELIGDAEAYVSVDEGRFALGVEGEEVDRRAGLAGGVVGAAQRMVEEIAGELAAVAGRFRPADARGRQRAANAVDGVVIELAEFLWRAAPVADVRLVPHFEIPRLHFRPPV